MRAFFILTAVFSIALLSLNSFAADSRSISVSGQCEVALYPDRGAIVFNVTHLNNDVKKATQLTNKISEKLIRALKTLSLKDSVVSTESYNVHEKKEWVNRKNIFKGYEASMAIRLETSEIKKIHKTINIANDLKIKNIGNLNLFTSLKLQSKLSIDCLQMATTNAQLKADKLLSNLDAKVGKILQVIEVQNTSRNDPMPTPRFAKSMSRNMVENLSAPVITGKKQFFKKEITFIFEII
jgi:uncharacterized protein YggE